MPKHKCNNNYITRAPFNKYTKDGETTYMKKLLITTPAVAVLAMSSLFAFNAPAANASSDWDRLAQCESGGDWNINTGNGYYGGLQFSQQSWEAVGGSGNPAQASKSEQIQRGEQLRQIQGWGAWPSCSAQLGLSGSPSGSPAPAPAPAPAPETTTEAPAQVEQAPQQESVSPAPVEPVAPAPAPAPAPVEQAPVTVDYSGETYVVQSGDTLHEIAVAYDVEGGYDTLAAWNDDINDPGLIFAGQEIIVN